MPQFPLPSKSAWQQIFWDFPGSRPGEKENKTYPNTMPDILYILASIVFFVLMIAFIWACEKV